MKQIDISFCQNLVEQFGKEEKWTSVTLTEDYALCAEPIEEDILVMLCRRDGQGKTALLREVLTRRWRAPQEFIGIQVGVVAKLGVCAILRMPRPEFAAQNCMQAADRMMPLLT